MAFKRQQEPSGERPPDVQIDATVRAKQLRFATQPYASVGFRGEWLAESDSRSERENLPEEVESSVTYRNVRVAWRATAWVEAPSET